MRGPTTTPPDCVSAATLGAIPARTPAGTAWLGAPAAPTSGCAAWREKYPTPPTAEGSAAAPAAAALTLGAHGVCRLCFKHATYVREPNEPFDPIAANKHGQQLFFADMFTQHKDPVRRPAVATESAPAASTEWPQPPEPHWLIPQDQQLTLFPAKPDLAAHGRAGLHKQPTWTTSRSWRPWQRARHHPPLDLRQRYDAIIGVRIMLGIQDDGRAPIRASEVEALRDIDLPVWSVIKILSTAGALIEDRTPQPTHGSRSVLSHCPSRWRRN